MEQINSLRVATEAYRIDEKTIIRTSDETNMTDLVTSIEQIKAILQDIRNQFEKQDDKLTQNSEKSENNRYKSEFTKIKDLLDSLFSNQNVFHDISTSQKKIETRVTELVEVMSKVEQNSSIESKKSSSLTKRSEKDKFPILEEKILERFEERLSDYQKAITNEFKKLISLSGTPSNFEVVGSEIKHTSKIEKILEQLSKEFEKILSERIPKREDFTNQYNEEISNCIVSLKTVLSDIKTVLRKVINISETHSERQKEVKQKPSGPNLSISSNRNKNIELVIVVDGSDSFSNKSRVIF